MADLFRGQSGQIYAKLPGNRYEPVTPEQAALIQEGGLEAFMRSAQNSAAQALVGMPAIVGAGDSRQQFGRLQEEQQARGMGNPLATMAGSIAPDIAVGAFTGGTGSIARRAAMTGLAEGALGATRAPDNPLAGAALQGGLGALGGAAAAVAAPMIGRGFMRGKALADTVIGRSRASRAPMVGADDAMGAARNFEPTFETGVRQLRGYATPDQLTRAGFKINPTERMALEATSKPELDAAIRQLDRDEVIASTNIFGPLQAGDLPGNRWARDDHRSAFVNWLGKQVGEDSLETATRRRMGEMLGDQQQVFKDLIDNNPNPIRMDEVMDPASGETFADFVRNIANDAPVNAERQLADIADKIEKAIDADGVIDPKNFRSLHKEVSDSVRRNLTGQSGNRELGFAMGQVKAALDDAAERVITKFQPRKAEQLAEARKNYGIIMAALRGRATDPDGMINPKTFANNYARYHPGYARGKTDNEFTQVLDAAIWLTHKRTPESGTGARVVGAIGQQLPTIGGTAGGLGLLGGLLGE